MAVSARERRNARHNPLIARYSATHLNDIPTVGTSQNGFRAIRHHFGIRSFGVNAFVGAAAGDLIVNEHDEEGGQEELYLVAEGRARFEIDGESVDAPAGTFVYAEPSAKRTAFAEEPGTTIVVVGGTPGQAYQARGFEVWAPFHAIYEAGKPAEAADAARAAVEASDYPLPYFNLACCEALAGRKAEALGHLRQAIERSDEMRELAKQDTDLDSLRDDPEFAALLAG